MAAIYLEHPVHGQKVACGDQEAAYDRSNGWTDFDPTATTEPVAVEPAVPSFLAPAPVIVSDLPPDFPGREALIEGGLTEWAHIVGKTSDELVALKGIGLATATKILEVMDS